jgi:hypothetical protein
MQRPAHAEPGQSARAHAHCRHSCDAARNRFCTPCRDLQVRTDLDLPPLDPFANAAPRIDATAWLTTDDRSFLIEKLAALHDGYASLEFVLPRGVIHGDASVGNVLRDRDGAAVLIEPGRCSSCTT